MRVPMTRIYLGFRSHAGAALPSGRCLGGNDSNELVTWNPAAANVDAAFRRRRSDLLDYFSRLITLNIGMYRAMTAAPTAPPITAIRSGSMSDVRASTVAVTSLL
jgi:hypothetical protein